MAGPQLRLKDNSSTHWAALSISAWARLLNRDPPTTSCRRPIRAAALEGANVESAGVAGYAHSYGPSTSQEQPQWIPSSHCSGAVNKSVPDSAVHPNNEPSRENITPLASNERRRSVLLHQRAQLLKQLEEMDKLLESIPPDDSSDGQSPHTAIQSQTQSHLSADCSSPTSYDGHSETCDLPEDPAEESEKKENASSESEDDDPDYLPNSDGDLSDVQSDTDGGSSDESSHSSSSTPTDEPSLQEKKKAKSGGSLRDLGVSDGFRSVLCEMIYDDVTQTVMEDKVILQFGEQMYNQHGSDVKKHDYIRQNLRQIARLVIEAQKLTPLKNLEDFFYPSSFRHVVSAVKVLAGYDPENKTYNCPSLALKLGYHLQKACNIVEDNAVKAGDTSRAESARNFLSVYQKKWNMLISSGALTTLRETKLTTEKKVPFAQDVKRLNFYLENAHILAEKKLEENPSTENYAALAKLMNLDEDEADQILGPNNQVRTLRQSSDMQLDDVEMDTEATLQPETGQQTATWGHTEHSGACYEPADFYHRQTHGVTTGVYMTAPPKSVNSGNRGSQYKGKHKWEEAEVRAVERHMMRFIQGHKVPQKNDCIQCLEAEPKALRTPEGEMKTLTFVTLTNKCCTESSLFPLMSKGPASTEKHTYQ
ncbi:uncharacterized protein AKAME5_000701600 [Lates japonicus]|uniref:Uncharacterized protein n=1 Tax=Lates japonicus TaxID=270547 RepID=A0AAD3MH14_LATJO|nr:uncharacterized protein AKAME5_000701600 [Lates japonicus]